MRLLILSLLGAAAAFAQAADSTSLGARIFAAREANAARTRSWSYREHQITVQSDKNGKKRAPATKTWEVIGLEGSPYRRLIERNDKPLSPAETKKLDEAMRKEAASRRDSRRRGIPRVFSTSYSLSIPWNKLSEVYDLTVSGEEEISGQPVQIVDGVPRKLLATAGPREREASNYKVRMWILKSDGLPVRASLEIIGAGSKMKPGSRVSMEQFSAEDGTWLPRTVQFDFVMKVIGPFIARGVSTTTYSEFKKFQVDSSIIVEDSPQSGN